MKDRIDNFSRQSDLYKKYRPQYPQELYEYLIGKVTHTNECWDCGAGNGQVAADLAKYFNQVYATDISKNQFRHAIKKDNISYSISRAEQSHFKNNKFDLVAVAQAVHWFDIEAFNKEAKRVSKNGGSIAIWGYGLLGIDKKVNPFIQEFYYETVYDYWDAERKYIDDEYKSVKFDFDEVEYKRFTMEVEWSLEQLKGYLNSWSSVQNYRKAHNGKNPVSPLSRRLEKIWPGHERKKAKFPIFMKAGKHFK